MEDIDCWEEKFESCIYSDKLLNKITELNKLVKNPVNIWEVKKACYYARKYHGPQMRQSGEPYYSHPIEVAYQFAEYTAKYKPIFFIDTLLQTAILHDVIEDTILTENMITNIFNKKVAIQVEALTRIKLHGKISSAKMVDLLVVEGQNKHILLIKLFDRLHNIQTIGAKVPEKQKKVLIETLRSFIILASYLEVYQIEAELTHLCLQINSNITPPALPKTRKSFYYDNFQNSSALTFQND